MKFFQGLKHKTYFIEAAGTIFSDSKTGINLSFTIMQFNNEIAQSNPQEIVEIKLWGLYLLINRPDLSNEMIQCSLDNGPVEKNPQTAGRITFRFNASEWESKIKRLLYVHRVPVIIKSNAYQQWNMVDSGKVLA